MRSTVIPTAQRQTRPQLPDSIRWTLILLPIAAALGGMASLGGPVVAFRVLAVFLAINVLLLAPAPATTVSRWTMLLASTWFAVALALVLVRGTSEQGFRELGSLIPGLLLLAAVARLEPARVLPPLILGWLLAFGGSVAVAVWESATDRRLSNFYLGARAAVRQDVGVAATFGNPNNFAFFLACCLPLLLAIAASSESQRRWIGGAGALVTVVLIATTGSRLGLLIVIAQSVLFLALLGRHPLRRQAAGLTAAATMVILVVVPNLVTRVGQAIGQALTTINLPALLEEVTSQEFTSGSARLHLTLDGIGFFFQSWLLGLGPAGFERAVLQSRTGRLIGDLVNPHNGWVEILTQYGLIVFLMFLTLLVIVFFACADSLRHAARNQRPWSIAGIVLVASCPALLVMNSTFIQPFPAWMFLATLLVLGRTAERVNRHG